jgi:hypothetical protein
VPRDKRQAAQKSSTGYAVGYRRPPMGTRFQPGQSGNPKGRPKGVRNTASLAHDALEQTILVEEKQTKRKMTVRELAYRQVAEKAMSGDIKALNYLLARENDEHRSASDQHDSPKTGEHALEIVQAFLDRQRAAKGDKK